MAGQRGFELSVRHTSALFTRLRTQRKHCYERDECPSDGVPGAPALSGLVVVGGCSGLQNRRPPCPRSLQRSQK
jgi:hypothetical protein